MSTRISSAEGRVALLRCGSEQASAFFVTPTLAFAARHSIIDHLDDGAIPITLQCEGVSGLIAARVAAPEIPVTEDIVLLEAGSPVSEEFVLPLAAAHTPRGLRWEGLGFPSTRSGVGVHLHGTVARSSGQDPYTPSDVDLDVAEFGRFHSYAGFSGSPVIANGYVSAILQKQLDGCLGAISILRLRPHLDAAGIPFLSHRHVAGISPRLAQTLADTAPNTTAYRDLEEALLAASDSYVILSGAPGAGKTIAAAGFQPQTDGLLVVGRYFGGGDGDTAPYPADYYRDAGIFAQWLASETGLCSGHARPSSPDHQLREHTVTVAKNLDALAEHCAARNVRGVLIIDDAASSGSASPTSLLRVLPSTPPRGLSIVITASDTASLLSSAPDIIVTSFVTLAPLSLYECERFARRALHGRTVPAATILDIAATSGGHPLVLNYLVREAKEGASVGGPQTNSGGPLTLDRFYDTQWRRLNNPSGTLLLGTLARLRGPVVQGELIQMLPQGSRLEAALALPRIRHLLSETTDGLLPFHSSFGDFVAVRTAEMDEVVHDSLATYCKNTSTSTYALTNVVHHHLRGSPGFRSIAITLCSSTWLESVATRCVPPAHVMADTEELLRQSIRAGKLVDTVTVLLVRSRLRFRYNNILAVWAAEAAELASLLRGPTAALGFAVRGQQLLCSMDEVVHLLRRLMGGGAHSAAKELYQVFRRYCTAAYESDDASLALLAAHIDALCVVMPEMGPDSTRELPYLLEMLSANAPAGAVAPDTMWSHVNAIVGGHFLWLHGYLPAPRRNRQTRPGTYCTEVAFILARRDDLRTRYGHSGEELGRRPQVKDVQFVSANELAVELAHALPEIGVLAGTEMTAAEMLMRYGQSKVAVGELGAKALMGKAACGLRATNGVDANLEAVRTLFFAAKVDGYCGTRLAKSLSTPTRHAWEKRLLRSIEALGRAVGRTLGKKRRPEKATRTILTMIRKSLLPLMSWSLADRAEWEDSYGIPESILPEIYGRLTAFVATCEPNSLSDTVELICRTFSGQLGLYDEGFRASVLRMIQEARVASSTVAADLANRLFTHIDRNVMNRYERVPALVTCATALALSGRPELAETAFRSAVNSSLGPNWYKEEQFGILLDAFEAVVPANAMSAAGRTALEVLELASGEVTFQRYVRSEKVQLIEKLASSGFNVDAITLFLHYVQPTDDIQRQRIRSETLDCISSLETSRFGVREIDEQGAAAALLRGMQEASCLRRWAIVEIFCLGDDRYAADFGRAAAEVLRVAGPLVAERLSRMLRADFSLERRWAFVREVVSHDDSGRAAALVQELQKQEILSTPETDGTGAGAPTIQATEPKRSDPLPAASPSTNADNPKDKGTDDGPIMPGVFGHPRGLEALRASLGVAKASLEAGHAAVARAALVKGLTDAQNTGWGLWANFPDAKEALTLLLQKTSSVQEALRSLEAIIVDDAHAADWLIASALMRIGGVTQSTEEKEQLWAEAVAHLRAMLAPELGRVSTSDTPPPLVFSKEDVDVQLDRFFVELLDHANQFTRGRVADVLVWLACNGQCDPNTLVKRCRSGVGGHGRELAIGILHALALRAPAVILESLDLPSLKTLTADENFAIRYGVEEVLRLCSSLTDRSVAVTLSAEGRVAAPKRWRWERGLRAAMKATRSKKVEGDARHWLTTLTGGDPEEVKTLWATRCAALGCQPDGWSTPSEREAVFRAIPTTITNGQRCRIAEEVMWNPLWPEMDLSTSWRPIGRNILKRLAQRAYEQCFVVDGRTVVHCWEMETVQEEGKPPRLFDVEITAFLVPSSVQGDGYDLKAIADNRSVHAPDREPRKARGSQCQAAVIRFPVRRKIGGDVTPARPTSDLLETSGLRENEFRRIVWRDGRKWNPWGAGPISSQGTALLMGDSLRLTISGKDLVWMVSTDGQPRMIVDPSRRQIYQFGKG